MAKVIETNDSHVSDSGGSRIELEIELDDTGQEMEYLLSNSETSNGAPGKCKDNRFAEMAKRIKIYLSDTGIGEGGGNGVVGALYGSLSLETRRKTAWLSLCLFVIIGGFWLLDSLKDTVLEKSIGMEYQPQVKVLSLLLTLALVVQYNRIIDFVWKPVLFYVVGGCYTGVFTVMALVLFFTEKADHIDGSKTSPSTATVFVSHPPAILGWLSYVAIESYISVTIGLFWAYVNTSVDLEEAKACYGIIIAGAQVGAILGSTTATFASTENMRHPLRVSTLYLIGGLTPALMSCIIYMFERTLTTISLREREVTDNGMRQGQRPAPAAGMGIVETFKSGFRLMTSHRYLPLLMGVSCLYEVVLTVIDYEMKVLAVNKYRNGVYLSPHSEGDFTALMGHFGQTTNFLSLAMSFFGTSLIVRSLGLPLAISIFPCLLILGVLISTVAPSLPTLFIIVSVLKSLTYSLGEPCKEMLYMVTSDNVKFKAKGWIDMFGSRCAKGLGSLITNFYSGNIYSLSTIGSSVIFCISVVLFAMSVSIGVQFQKLEKTGQLICSDDEMEVIPISLSELQMHQSCLVGSDPNTPIHQSPISANLSHDIRPKIMQVERNDDL